MKAVYIGEHGDHEVLTYGDFDEPIPDRDEIKIKVVASSINRLDIYTRQGVRGLTREFPPPLILGGDCSGFVDSYGKDVIGFRDGDRVVVNPKLTCRKCTACLLGKDDLCNDFKMLGTATNGSYAEYVVVPASNVFKIYDDIRCQKAAAMPTTYLPMFNMMVRKGQLLQSETVLVLSASAGVGTAAIQIAKHVIGATVIATTSNPTKVAKAKDIGADEVIDYSKDDIYARVKEITNGTGVDMVVDHVGSEFFHAAYRSLRPGGRYGNCGVTSGYKVEFQLGSMFTRQITLFGVFMGSSQDMGNIVDLLNQRKIDPIIDSTFPLSNTANAHKLLESTQVFGKVILET